MEWKRNVNLEDQLLDQMWEGIKEDRSGLSVTSLLYCLTKAYYDKQAGGTKPDRKTLLFFTTGLALETVILDGVMQGHQKPTAGEFEGIAFHTDSFDPVTGVDEFKSTRKKMTDIPIGDDLGVEWHRQFKAYCKMHDVTTGRFIVLQVIYPELYAFDCEYTQEEIDENWNYILERKETYLEYEEKDERPPPFTTNQDWECRNCTYKMICDVSK